MNVIPVKVINNNPRAYNGFAVEGRPQTNLNASISADSQATLSVSGSVAKIGPTENVLD